MPHTRSRLSSCTAQLGTYLQCRSCFPTDSDTPPHTAHCSSRSAVPHCCRTLRWGSAHMTTTLASCSAPRHTPPPSHSWTQLHKSTQRYSSLCSLTVSAQLCCQTDPRRIAHCMSTPSARTQTQSDQLDIVSTRSLLQPRSYQLDTAPPCRSQILPDKRSQLDTHHYTAMTSDPTRCRTDLRHTSHCTR